MCASPRQSAPLSCQCAVREACLLRILVILEKNCDLRLLDFETFGGFGDGVRRILRQAADQLSNKLSHAQHLDEVTWTTKNWHGLQMQRLSVVLHTAVAWQTVNELACGDSGIVHGAKCIAVLNGVA